MGSQMARLRREELISSGVRSGSVHPKGKQHKDADDHGEGVLVDVARLEQTHDAGNQPTSRAEPLTTTPSISA